MTRSSRGGSVETAEAHWVEWLAGGVSALLVAALLGWLARDALTYRQEPPAFAIEIVSVTAEAGGYRVAFALRNTASAAAAGVEVAGTLAGGERAGVTFDYVAAHSGETGALFFRGDPRAGGLSLAVAGYTDP